MQFNQDPQQPSLGQGGNFGGDSGNYGGGGDFSQPQGLSQFQNPSGAGTPMNSAFGGFFNALNNFNGAQRSGAVGPSPYQQQNFGNMGWTPGYDNHAGYNPYQYADLNTTNQLAQALGGSALQTKMGAGDPFNVPPQNSIDFGGDSPLNAGLLADRYSKYDRATADAMTRAELAMQGPKNTAPDAAINTQFQSLPGGQNHLGGGTNMGQYVAPTAPPTPAATTVPDRSTSPANPLAPAIQQVTPHTAAPNPTPTIQPDPAAPPTGGSSGNGQFNLQQLLSLLFSGGAQQRSPFGQGISGMRNPSYGNNYGYGNGMYQNAPPQMLGNVGAKGQFNNFMTGNGYQRQGSMWLRPGQSPYQSAGTMSGFANTMNAFQNHQQNPFNSRQFSQYQPTAPPGAQY